MPSRGNTEPTYDVFICHASEDKRAIVGPLADELRTWGLEVWYDDFELEIGDSLTQSINEGLKSSRFGLVVLSGAFFEKDWPQYELNGLVQRHMKEGGVILPLWYGVGHDDVYAYNPSLADLYAEEVSTENLDDVANAILSKIDVSSGAGTGGPAKETASASPFSTVTFRFQGFLDLQKGDKVIIQAWRNHNPPEVAELEAVELHDEAGTTYTSDTKGVMMTVKTVDDRPLEGRVSDIASRSSKETRFEARIAEGLLVDLPDESGFYRAL